MRENTKTEDTEVIKTEEKKNKLYRMYNKKER